MFLSSLRGVSHRLQTEQKGASISIFKKHSHSSTFLLFLDRNVAVKAKINTFLKQVQYVLFSHLAKNWAMEYYFRCFYDNLKVY